jgi:hypothetical protein
MPTWSASLGDRLDRRPDPNPRPRVSWPAERSGVCVLAVRLRLRVRPIPEPGLIIIGYLMPLFGLELLGMARDVATFNLPAWVGQLFGVSL